MIKPHDYRRVYEQHKLMCSRFTNKELLGILFQIMLYFICELFSKDWFRITFIILLGLFAAHESFIFHQELTKWIECDIINTWNKIIKKTNILLIGDPHDQLQEWFLIANSNPDKTTIALGDCAVGFKDYREELKQIPGNAKFLCGNHGNPQECKKYPNWLGRFGFFENIFFIDGAKSIDKQYRTEGVSWWRDEELSAVEFRECFELYADTKPNIVISHAAPSCVVPHMVQDPYSSSTEKFLNELWLYHKPELWIYGHYHKSFELQLDKTKFKCLAPLEIFELCLTK